MAAHQAPPSLGFSRQEHRSGLPFPFPMHESEVVQSCPTLCEPMDCSLPGSSVHGIFQARVLEWVDIPFSNITQSEILIPKLALHSLTVFLISLPPGHSAPDTLASSALGYLLSLPLAAQKPHSPHVCITGILSFSP